MLLITCPHCGPRAQAEFTYERTTDSVVRLGDAPDLAMKALYRRANPRGVDEEIWRHSFGCRAWMIVTRDRIRHRIESVRAAGPDVLP